MLRWTGRQVGRQVNRQAGTQDDPQGSGWDRAWMLAICWGVLPALPALMKGGIPGSPWTDLYPSVWGLDAAAAAWPGILLRTSLISAPEGVPFYYSSPIHGWLLAPVLWLAGPVVAYAVGLVLARAATVLAAFGAGRAVGLGPWGALAAAGIYGASPFFQGYAVEGIIEGQDGWALAGWAWAVGAGLAGRPAWAAGRPAGLAGRPGLAPRASQAVLAALMLWLAVMSSWYLGIVACFLALCWGWWNRTAWWSLAGLIPAAPFLAMFLSAMSRNPVSGEEVFPAEIRAMMGTTLRMPTPGIWPGDNPFAMTSYIGFSTLALALLGAREPRRRPLAAVALACWVLSFGVGFWYLLPVLEAMRFPYRWHAGTLLCLGWLAGAAVDRIRWKRVALLPVLEGVLLSPVELILPTAPADVPAIYDEARGPLLLEVPGPVALPPGERNPSRPRARYLLFYQVFHRAASPWAFDFNGLQAVEEPGWLTPFRGCDPLWRRHHPEAACGPFELEPMWLAGVTQILLHRSELGRQTEEVQRALEAAGARLERTADGPDGELILYSIAPEEGAP